MEDSDTKEEMEVESDEMDYNSIVLNRGEGLADLFDDKV